MIGWRGAQLRPASRGVAPGMEVVDRTERVGRSQERELQDLTSLE